MSEDSPMRDLVARPELAVLTCAEMSSADRAAIAGGVPGTVLMENAGRAVAAAVMERFPRHRVVVLCGPGNNGGDGFVAARLMKAAGWDVAVAPVMPIASLKGDAAWAARQWKGPVVEFAPALLGDRPLIVDALYGAGLARPISGVAAEIIDRINADSLPVIAVDVPSGLSGDTGEVVGTAPFACATVTFFRAKPGHYIGQGLARCGALQIAEIGIPAKVLEGIGSRLWRNERALWAAGLRRGAADDHKYRRGHLTVLGGATACGAARLAAMAGRRAGAGLVTIAAPAAAMGVYLAAEPGNLVVEVEEAADFSALLADERRNAILIGPGSGLNPRTRGAALAAVATGRPTLLDADAITVFGDAPGDVFAAIRGPVLMTPHEGEFRRLFPDLATEASKVERARKAAARSGATILLKGADTVIASPDGRTVINVHAPSSLATAGSGDVLAGIAAGLMAQGLSPLAAGAAAAWLHGESAYRFGAAGLIAEDLIDGLPQALGAAMN